MIDNESGEDYLETVLRLLSTGNDVHAVDVARRLGVSKPAVTKAMRILTQKDTLRSSTTTSTLRLPARSTRAPCMKSTAC